MGTWMEPGWVWEPGWELEWEPEWEAGWEPEWEPDWEAGWEPDWEPGWKPKWEPNWDQTGTKLAPNEGPLELPGRTLWTLTVQWRFCWFGPAPGDPKITKTV